MKNDNVNVGLIHVMPCVYYTGLKAVMGLVIRTLELTGTGLNTLN